MSRLLHVALLAAGVACLAPQEAATAASED